MTNATKAALKAYFNTGDEITETSLHNLIDSTKSNYLVYASAYATLDGDIAACTGTDRRAALQTALDDLESAGGGTLVIDGVAALAGALVIASNCSIVGYGDNCGFCMLANSGSTAIRNKTFVSSYNGGSPTYTGSTIVDHHIRLENFKINAGRTVSSGGGSNGPQFNAQNQYAAGIQMFGVKYFTMQNVTVLDAPAFGLHASNIFYFKIDNCSVLDSDCLNFTSATRQGDGFHFEGPARYGHITNITIATQDDGVSLCSDSWNLLTNTGNNLKGPTAFGGTGGWDTVFRGPIEDIVVDGVVSIFSMTAFRLFSGYGNITGATSPAGYIDRVVFNNINGKFFHGIGHMQLQDMLGGDVRSVTVSNVNAVMTATGDYLFGGLDGVYQQLRFCNISRNDLSGGVEQYIRVTGTVGELIVDGVDIYESANATGTTLILISGSVDFARITNCSWVRKSGLTPTVSANALITVSGSGTIGTIQLSNIHTNRVGQVLLANHSGTLGQIVATNIVHENSTVEAFKNDGASKRLQVTGYVGDTGVSTGTWSTP